MGAGGASFLLALWLLGVLLAAVRPLLGLWGIGKLGRSSRAETGLAVLTTAAECAAALGLPRTPVVRRGDVPVPMTWGLHRPVVLLPDAASDWPEGRLRAVLLHEMAHIRRRDWAAHRLADLACALYWFHPLVWLTARRLRDESELACDDLVLSCGIPAPDYARHLLDIARALSPAAPPAPTGAIGMARTARVEGRITQMLNPTQNRRAVTRRTVFAALLAAALGVGTLAALKPEARAQVPSSPKPLPQQSTKAPSEIIGITNAAMPKQGWWDSDGKPIPAPAFSAGLHLSDGHITAKPGERPLLIAFSVPPAQETMARLYDITGKTQAGLTMIQMRAHPRGKIVMTMQSFTNRIASDTSIEGAAFPMSLSQTKIRIGTPSPQWTAAFVLHCDSPGENTKFTIAEDHYGTVDIFSDKIKYSLPLKEPGDFYDLRLIAVDKHGRQTLLPALKTESHGNREEITVPMPHNLTQLQEIRVEAKPFIWTVYNNVALQPAQAEAHP